MVVKDKVNFIEQYRRKFQQGNINPVMRRKIMVAKKSIQSIYPHIPRSTTSATYGYQSKENKMKGRGRPKGSVTYSINGRPVGVFEHRRYISSQKKAYRDYLNQQREQIKMQRQMARMPQYEQVQQMPQQIQQVQQMQQMPQPQQYPQPQPPQREIATVFRGSGGKPYPAVERRPLQPTRQTIPQGYVEVVDSFTGRRFLKQLPQAERWARGGY